MTLDQFIASLGEPAGFSVCTIGCKVNQSESASLAAALTNAGWHRDDHTPSLVILNTCAVTTEAERKSRKTYRHVQTATPGARVVVTGCGLEHDDRPYRRGKTTIHMGNSMKGELCREAPAAPAVGRTRAYLKVQDGCDQVCTYCIVPAVRGRETSVTWPEIERAAAALSAARIPEVVLVGIHLGRWSDDGFDLARLVCELAGSFDFRLRLSSIEVDEVTDELLDAIEHERVCPHLHLPIQSGSDRILSLMGRGYTRDDVCTVVERLRDREPGAAVSCDVMVGFPGELDEDVEATKELLDRICPCRTHVFAYSLRPGTPAETLGGVVAGPEKKRRAAQMRAHAQRSAAAYARSCVGREVLVVVEEQGPLASGRCEYYMKVELDRSFAVGSCVRATVTASKSDGLIGQVKEDPA